MSRFVDRRSALLLRRLEHGKGEKLLAAVSRSGEVLVEGELVGAIGGFAFRPDPDAAGADRRLVLRAARRALYAEIPRRVAALEAANDTAFTLAGPILLWEGVPVARLERGIAPWRPLVHVLRSEFLDGPARERVRARLQVFLDARIRAELAPLFAAEAATADDPELRGPVHLLLEGLGVVPRSLGPDLSRAARSRLAGLGIRAGHFALFMPALLKPAALRTRALLAGIAGDLREQPALPPPGRVAWDLERNRDQPGGAGAAPFAAAMGWLPAGPVAIRLDVAERVAAELRARPRGAPLPLPPGLAGRLGIKAALLPVVLRQLGFRLIPDVAAAPAPAPPLLVPIRRRTGEATPRPDATGPFAPLAMLDLG